MDSQQYFDRRAVVRAAGVTALGAFAGCLEGEEGGEADGPDENDSEIDEEGRREPSGEGGEPSDETPGGTPDNEESGDDSEDLDEWFENTDNYEGVQNYTGRDEVTIAVGAGDRGLLFEPAAVEIGVDTTVVWEWTGDGGAHNVVDEDGEFQSETVEEEGHTFEHVFETEGTYRYVCELHAEAGMAGAVVVGAGETDKSEANGENGENATNG